MLWILQPVEIIKLWLHVCCTTNRRENYIKTVLILWILSCKKDFKEGNEFLVPNWIVLPFQYLSIQFSGLFPHFLIK